MELFKKFYFLTCPLIALIRNDHDEIEEAFSPSNANCVCPIEIFLFVCAENRILISLFTELRILKVSALMKGAFKLDE